MVRRRRSRPWLSTVPYRSNCDVAVRRRRPARSSTMSGGSGRPTATFPLPRCDTTGQDVALPALASSGTTVVAFGDLARVKGRTQFSMAHHLPCGELACGAVLWRLLQLFPFDGLPDGCCRSVVAARAGVEGISMWDAPTAAGRVMYAGGLAMGIQGVATVVAGECYLGKLPIGPRACPQSSVCPASPGTRPQVLGFRRAGRELLRRTGRRPTYIQYETVRRACPVHTPDAERAARREDEGTARPRTSRYSTGWKLASPARTRLRSATPEALNGSQPMKPRVTPRYVAPSWPADERVRGKRCVRRMRMEERAPRLPMMHIMKILIKDEGLKSCGCNWSLNYAASLIFRHPAAVLLRAGE